MQSLAASETDGLNFGFGFDLFGQTYHFICCRDPNVHSSIGSGEQEGERAGTLCGAPGLSDLREEGRHCLLVLNYTVIIPLCHKSIILYSGCRNVVGLVSSLVSLDWY